ncbi:MAG TPA: PAS domain S-box protein [Opitutaceae bacterium]|nr:PAS domain S-box protein [Opitutaceae bacterium]
MSSITEFDPLESSPSPRPAREKNAANAVVVAGARNETRDEDAPQLADLRRLHEATLRVVRTPGWEPALREILSSTVAALGGTKGLFSLASAGGTARVGEPPVVVPAVSVGFSAEFAERVKHDPRGRVICAACGARGERVVVEDAAADPLFAQDRALVATGEFRAGHGVPVFRRDGALLGALSVYYAEPHTPGEREKQLLDLYAQMAADCSERAGAEQQLREREAQFRVLSLNAPVVLAHLDREGRVLFASRAMAERWSSTPEALAGRHLGEVIGDEAFAAVEPDIRRVLGGETRAFEIDLPLQQLGRRFVRVAFTPDCGEDGSVRGYFAAVSDLTERRRAELAWRESEERLRLATRTGKVGLWDWDIAANRLTWTDSLYEIHGVTPARFVATMESFMTLVHPDDRVSVAREIQSSVEAEKNYETEFRAVRPDGETIWLFTNAVVLRDGGRPVRMLGATLDVTGRKRAELALRESEERFRALASHAPVGIFLTNSEGDCLFVNAAWCAMTGLEPEAAAGRGWTSALHPDDRERIAAEWYAAVAEKRPFSLEYRFLRPDGKVTWVQGGATEFRDGRGRAGGHVGTVVDITEQKAADFALRESEKRFRTLARRAPVGIFMTNPRGETIFVNDSWCAISGLTAEQALGDGWLHAVHPDDRAGLLAGWDEAVRSGVASLAEYRFMRADGSVAWVQGNAVQLRDASGRLTGYVGTIADFTARKQAEERLRAREAQLRLISTQAPIVLAHCDRERRYLFVNRAFAERFAREPEEIVGRTLDDVLGAEAVSVLQPFIDRVLAGEPVEFETEVPYAVLGRRHMRVSYTPDSDDAGRVRGWLAAIGDITQQKRAERNATFLARLSQELGTLIDPAEIASEAARMLGHHLGAQRCGFVENRGDVEVAVIKGWVRDPLPSLAGHYRTADFGGREAWHAIARGKVAIDDITTHVLTREFAANFTELGVRAIMTAPFVREDRWVAAIALTSGQPRAWTEDEVALLEDVVTRVWPLIERARAEAGLHAAQAQLQSHAQELERKVAERTASLREAIAQMEEFSYSVSHDLRGPLRAMHTYAEALVEDYGPQLDATARNYLERIQRSSVRMEKLTHDVLTYSRLARTEVELVPLDVEKILREIVEQYAELQPGVATVEMRTPLEPVRGHASLLSQCLGNLLTNAAKFVREGERPRIEIYTEASDDRVRIWVVDDGIGIPSQYHGALFQVFERLPAGTHYEGTGIGLAIVRKAAEKMGGRCGVESDGEHGSRFWVELAKG